MADRHSFKTTNLSPFLLTSLSIHLLGMGLSSMHKAPVQYSVVQAPPSIAVSIIEETVEPVISEKVLEPVEEQVKPEKVVIEADAIDHQPLADLEIDPMAVEHPQIDAPQVKVFKRAPKEDLFKKFEKQQPVVKPQPKELSKPKPAQPPKKIQKSVKPLQQPRLVQKDSTGAKTEAAPLTHVNPAPDYPKRAIRRGWEGRVMLRVRVESNGLPSAVELEQSSGRKILDEAAIETVKKWRFEPAKAGAMRFSSWISIPVEFRLIDAR